MPASFRLPVPATSVRWRKRAFTGAFLYIPLGLIICRLFLGCREPFPSIEDHISPQLIMDERVIPRSCQGKERLVQILLDAGIPAQNMTEALCKQIPTWKQMTDLYGDEPVVYGLDTCVTKPWLQTRRSDSSVKNQSFPLHFLPRVAGLYNTGTNALSIALYNNLHHDEGSSVPLNATTARLDDYYQVPWAKHMPAPYRNSVSKTPPEYTLPIVLVRDPFRWMKSMCKANYLAEWKRAPQHCPNLVPNRAEQRRPRYRGIETFLVTVNYGNNITLQYDSLADMWSTWNRQYLKANFSRIMIRFEDMLFHADEVMSLISECTGIPRNFPYRYLLGESKEHGQSSDFLSAVIKYGASSDRYLGMSPEDIAYARVALDPTLLNMFHYPLPL